MHEDDAINLTLPYPPSANHYLRRTSRGVYRTPEAQAYKETVALTLRLEGVEPLTGDLEIVVDAYRPRKRGDLDNILKVALDSLNGLAWHDDKQIARITANRHDDPKRPRLEIAVWQMEKQAA